ncbi:amino acid/amide ABC transporter membrane protein 1 (HAAT family) [Primorskyibacter sedentarius]|uniref:Amino acid/amide ABC transporter membrane protein 1 (HAAT family) n=1 Tax=Primorskyibacter sedentarius TaxID=745311 RepID=A0A4R3JL50_9RHOB|nr:urea ABC transporter permease subunit UrtB [Primorskyibacter sedentarius]TCS66300.1 amino acid/amide ABC transporter membrane protein 1 (HAAT family) [Primorskyibacter sedentarius]
MKQLLLAALAVLLVCFSATAQETSIQPVLQEHQETILKSSRKTIGPAIDAIAASGLPQAQAVLEAWANKEMWSRESDGQFFKGEEAEDKQVRLIDFDTGDVVGAIAKSDLKQLKPNSGIRAMISTALVRFQLMDPDPAKRQDALTSIQRDPEASLLEPLRASFESETDPVLLAQKQRLERLLTIGYDTDTSARITAIDDMSGDLGVDLRATLNPLVATTRAVAPEAVPEGINVAKILSPGEDDFTEAQAYDMLVAKGLAPPRIPDDAIRNALADNISGGRVAGFPLAILDNDENRRAAYIRLAEEGLAPPFVTEEQIQASLGQHVFFDSYADRSPEVTEAAVAALRKIDTKVGLNQSLDLVLDALSLASIYFLAAIGLAITFGVMGVINMAHGEFIMMGAYTGYVVQQIIPDHTISIIVAIPLAFAVTFAAGVAMERLVIRWLYSRPLETLLATFGISIALQQLAKNIFGTQARPLTSPGWLDGALVMNDVVSISYIRIAIFVLALIFLGVFLFIMKRTRLGLETRAVTQNPRMAASMGINPGRVNMLTFGLGSGIAGVAGVAIGLYAKVTSELGSDYIVQSFMTVVVGGVGNIWGTLLGATMIGFLQKGIEWLNPSNTLAAQTYMIVFIIIFIQFRPRGIIALKGRAAGD